MGTQKNRLNETVLLSTQNMCLKLWVRKYLQFYAENICLSKPASLLKERVASKNICCASKVQHELIHQDHCLHHSAKTCYLQLKPRHEISNYVVCATSKASDQPAHTRSLIRTFASCLTILRVLRYRLNIIWSF